MAEGTGIAFDSGRYRKFTGYINWNGVEGYVQNADFDIGNSCWSVTFYNGIWLGGTVSRCDWRGGVWKNGTWLSGGWEYGTWHDGTWHDGQFSGGVWENGVWLGGRFWAGTWKDGVWHDGKWYFGKWKNGTWMKGTIMDHYNKENPQEAWHEK